MNAVDSWPVQCPSVGREGFEETQSTQNWELCDLCPCHLTRKSWNLVNDSQPWLHINFMVFVFTEPHIPLLYPGPLQHRCSHPAVLSRVPSKFHRATSVTTGTLKGGRRRVKLSSLQKSSCQPGREQVLIPILTGPERTDSYHWLFCEFLLKVGA